MSEGFPRNLGVPGSSILTTTVTGNRTEIPLACQARARQSGSETANGERKDRYRQTKETKRGGKGDRASDWLIVPMKVGNRRPSGTQRREGAS